MQTNIEIVHIIAVLKQFKTQKNANATKNLHHRRANNRNTSNCRSYTVSSDTKTVSSTHTPKYKIAAKNSKETA